MLKFIRKKVQSLTKTQLNGLTALLVLINLGIVVFWINFWLSLRIPLPPEAKERTMEEILKSLTAPNEGREIPEEVLKSLTAPTEGREIPEDILKSLTAPK